MRENSLASALFCTQNNKITKGTVLFLVTWLLFLALLDRKEHLFSLPSHFSTGHDAALGRLPKGPHLHLFDRLNKLGEGYFSALKACLIHINAKELLELELHTGSAVAGVQHVHRLVDGDHAVFVSVIDEELCQVVLFVVERRGG